MCEMVMINDHDHQDHRDRQDHRDHHCDPHDTDNQILTVWDDHWVNFSVDVQRQRRQSLRNKGLMITCCNISQSVDDWGFDIYRMLINIPLCHAACMMRISWKRMKMLLSAETPSLRINSQYSRQKHALPRTCCRRGSGTWKGWRAFWDGFCRICTCHYHYHYLYYHRHFYPEPDFYGSALSNFRQRLLYLKSARKSGWWSYWSQDRPLKWHLCSAQFCKTLEKLIRTFRYNLYYGLYVDPEFKIR